MSRGICHPGVRPADMRLRDQLIGSVVLIVATWFGLLRIAEAKNETTVGGGVFRLEETRPEDREAFRVVLAQINRMGDRPWPSGWAPAAGRRDLGRAQDGAGRWAVFVESLKLVPTDLRETRGAARPLAHLYGVPRSDIPLSYQRGRTPGSALAGALRRKLAHRDGGGRGGPRLSGQRSPGTRNLPARPSPRLARGDARGLGVGASSRPSSAPARRPRWRDEWPKRPRPRRRGHAAVDRGSGEFYIGSVLSRNGGRT